MPPSEPDPHNSAAIDSAPLIDRADGLDRVMGDLRLYTRMLMRFRQDYHGAAEPMLRALETGNRALAHRQVHTLKGSAGMIGAHGLHALASEAEVALRTGSGNEHASLQQLGTSLRALLDELDTLLAPPAAMPAPAASSDTAHAVNTADTAMPAPALVARLMALLENGDGAAVDLVDHSAQPLQAIYGPVLYRRLVATVNDFNYAAALRLLRQASAADTRA